IEVSDDIVEEEGCGRLPRGQLRAIAGAVDGERISIRGVRIYAEAARIGRLVIGGTATGP
ncbi:hypothetical protein JVV71_20075, partial [Vibrio cholerae O1]|nr:hypothetical protein [Vibrio cholerae O1]